MNDQAPNKLHMTYSDDLEEVVLELPENPVVQQLREVGLDLLEVGNRMLALAEAMKVAER